MPGLRTYPWILDIAQTRLCERQTIAHEGIASIELMERAGARCAEKIADICKTKRCSQVVIFCGTGNNGGDGLVIAAHLSASEIFAHKPITVVVCASDQPRYSEEMQENLHRWKTLCGHDQRLSYLSWKSGADLAIDPDTLIVDAIFGIGLNKAVCGIPAEAIAFINDIRAFTIAIDIPSGLFADQHTPSGSSIVMADVTLTIQYPKKAFIVPELQQYYGEVRVLDIAMYPPEDMVCRCEYLTKGNIAALVRPAHPYAHKGSLGHGLLIAGSGQMPGAAILAATAALRGGLGKLTVHSAREVTRLLPTVLPEAILHHDADEQIVSQIDWETLPASINAVAIGPGLGLARGTVNAIKSVLDSYNASLIIDADALNMLANDKTWLAFLPPYSILTPHIGEFERLAGPSGNHFDRLKKAQTFAERYQVVLILKGHHTVISLPDGMQFVNTTGNWGMATAGSGDTLTGLLLALLAQGYNPVETALIGTYLHGLAGDIYIQTQAPQSLIASDIPKQFGKAFLSLFE
mgnify:CR=1 FL=1